MNTNMPNDLQFNEYYRKHLKCLKLAGMQPKTVEAYSRAIRRIGNYFDCRIDNLGTDQLLDYFHELLKSQSWSAVKLDLYGLKNAHLVETPLDRGGIQAAMKVVVKQLGIKINLMPLSAPQLCDPYAGIRG